MTKPTDNDVRASDMSGGRNRNGEFLFLRRLRVRGYAYAYVWRDDVGSEPFFKPPTSPFCYALVTYPMCLFSL